MKSITKFFLSACSLIIMALMLNSCEKKVTGCQDSTSENYNPDANVAGDCIYARDKFIGTFKGSLDCNLETLDNSDLTFSIEEKSGNNEEIRLLITLSGLPFILEGSITGNSISVAADLKGVPYVLLGQTIMIDVIASGNAVTTDGGKTLAGTITVTGSSNGLTLLDDTCVLTGVKQ